MKTMKFNLVIVLFSVFFFCSVETHAQSGRETWQPPEQIMDSIGVQPGMIIAEAGAGRGYFTIPLAKRIGEKGKIYANDISKSGLNTIQSISARKNLNNITTILGETEDPLFPNKDYDMIIMVLVLHELEKPKEFMKNLKKYMSSETQLVIIERNSSRDRAHYPSFMSNRQILEMLEKTDYELKRMMTFLPKDTIYIYKTKN